MLCFSQSLDNIIWALKVEHVFLKKNPKPNTTGNHFDTDVIKRKKTNPKPKKNQPPFGYCRINSVCSKQKRESNFLPAFSESLKSLIKIRKCINE